jgi:hypothetical protein
MIRYFLLGMVFFLFVPKSTYSQVCLGLLKLGDTFSINIDIGSLVDVTISDEKKNCRVYSVQKMREFKDGEVFGIRIYFNDKDSTVIGIIRFLCQYNSKMDFQR